MENIWEMKWKLLVWDFGRGGFCKPSALFRLKALRLGILGLRAWDRIWSSCLQVVLALGFCRECMVLVLPCRLTFRAEEW